MAKPKPIYVLAGSDLFLRDEHRRRIVAECIGDADPQLCVSGYDADAMLADVLDELRTLPFLAPHRVVIVTDADAFVTGFRQQLESYLESPASSSSLVLVVGSAPSNQKIWKQARKIGEVIDCNVPQRGGLGGWIASAAGKRGKKIAPAAATLLEQWVGQDMAALNAEIEKLSTYVGDRPAITEDDVSKLVVASAGAGAYDLSNALIAQDAKAALKALGAMMSARGEEFKILGLIAYHLRRVLEAHMLAAAGKSPEQALPPRMPYHAKNAFLSLLRRRSLAKVQQDFRHLIAADLAMKSGTKPVGAMEELVVALCS